MPADAGIHDFLAFTRLAADNRTPAPRHEKSWMPAFAGMTRIDMGAKARLFVSMVVLLPISACLSRRGPQVATPSYSPVCGCEADLFEHVGDRIFFDFDSSALSSASQAPLMRQAAWFAKYPNVNLLVAGNADERGTETYNLAIGQRRANAARDYLVSQGVSESHIHTISYGKDCPVAAGNDEASYQQNRNAITSVEGFNPQNCH